MRRMEGQMKNARGGELACRGRTPNMTAPDRALGRLPPRSLTVRASIYEADQDASKGDTSPYDPGNHVRLVR